MTRQITMVSLFQAAWENLNQRLLGHVASRNILHRSQIGFLPKNCTADHVFTLRTLVENTFIFTIKKSMLGLLILEKLLTQSGTMGS